MASTLHLPPDRDTPHRTEVERWAKRRNRPYNTQHTAPCYTGWLETIWSGLMQALPPTVEGVDETLTDRVHPGDVIDDAAALASSLGVSYLRPVRDAHGDWTLEVLSPTMVAPTWSHKTLTAATVWASTPDPRYDAQSGRFLVLVERWDTLESTVGVAVYAGTRDELAGGALKIDVDDPIEGVPDGLDRHPYFQPGARDTTPRRLVAVVHEWNAGRPVPLFDGNEGYLDGLERLDDQEQEDAELARHRIAMPADMIGTQTIVSADGQTVLAAPGFNANDNLLALPPGMSSQERQGMVEPIIFPDSMVQRERIERRQNTLLELCGISPASIGRNVTGRTDSGAAKRADQQLTAQTVARPGRMLSRALSAAYAELVALERSAPVADTDSDDDGDVADRPTVRITVRPGIRQSIEEAADTAAALAASESASIETRVRIIHPDWDDSQVATEVAAIDDATPSDPPLFE